MPVRSLELCLAAAQAGGHSQTQTGRDQNPSAGFGCSLRRTFELDRLSLIRDGEVVGAFDEVGLILLVHFARSHRSEIAVARQDREWRREIEIDETETLRKKTLRHKDRFRQE